MLSQLNPPKEFLPEIERQLRHIGLDAEIFELLQDADGRTTASFVGIDIGARSGTIFWLGDEQDGHAVLREVAFHLLFDDPKGGYDLPIIVLKRFSTDVRRFLAYEGRLPMQFHPRMEWLVISLESEVAGWFHNREITTLPTPRPERPSSPVHHVR